MKFTRKEIDYSCKVLEQLRQFEKLRGIADSYNRGCVTFSIDGNGGKELARIDCDGNGPRHPGDAAKVLEFDIAVIVRTAARKTIEDVIDRLKKEMPLPLED